MENQKTNWLEKNPETTLITAVIIILFLLCYVVWSTTIPNPQNEMFKNIEKRLIKIETILIMEKYKE